LQQHTLSERRRSSGKIAFSAPRSYVRRSNVALHTKESEMIRALERFFAALFAPLARELARMPSSAPNPLLPGF